MSNIDNVTEITVPSTSRVATITAWPDEVKVDIHTEDNVLTADQAREIAAAIVQAADQSRDLDWSGDDEFALVKKTDR